MNEKTSFHRVIDDKNKSIKDKDVKRVIICSGKIFYDLFEAREKK
jgi:2-oxoglutarate dehydrogenase E1 component